MRLPAERQCIFPDHGKLVACCPRGAYLWAASPLRRCLRAERWEADTLSDIVASFRRGENEPANSLDQRRFARRRPCQFLRARAAKHVERRGRRARDALSGGLDLKDNRGARRAVACDRRAPVARRGCCAVSQMLAAASAAARLIKAGHAAPSVRNDRRCNVPGYPGYRSGARLPDDVQILQGAPPANSLSLCVLSIVTCVALLTWMCRATA
jgi:hypothetical protein